MQLALWFYWSGIIAQEWLGEVKGEEEGVVCCLMLSSPIQGILLVCSASLDQRYESGNDNDAKRYEKIYFSHKIYQESHWRAISVCSFHSIVFYHEIYASNDLV